MLKSDRLVFERDNVCFKCNHTCYCVNMVSVTSASRYHPSYQSRPSMYILGLIPRKFGELAEAVPIDHRDMGLNARKHECVA